MDDRFVQPDGDRIRRLRQGHFWSQERLADAAGLRKRTVERAEAGKRLQRSTLRALAQALGYPPETLVTATSPSASPHDREPAPAPAVESVPAPLEGDQADRGEGAAEIRVCEEGAVARPISTDPLPVPLQAQATDGVARSARQGIPEAERRQLTVLFCDLVDSTLLATQRDPEDFRELVQAYQATCAEVIQRFDGYIAQYLGDGLLIYFGYPYAHEDDAQRAVRAGLEIVQAIARLNTDLHKDKGVYLSVRLGIHTGLVVVGPMGKGAQREPVALGETPNIAARLQGLGMPDTVVISAATHHLIQGRFECQDLGLHQVRGMTTPLQVYGVLGTSGTQSRFELAVATGLTPLVGRAQEVGLLLERWTQVKDGLGQVVVLSGEAGIGKSRLVQVVKAHVAGEPHLRWEGRCSPYYHNSALYPVIDCLQQAWQVERSAAPLETLEAVCVRYGLSLPEVVPLLAALLSVPLGERYPLLTLSPERQRQKTLEALLAVLLASAAQQPVVVILEDLHWSDPSTLEWLTLLIDQTPTARIFLLLTARPEFHPPWGFRGHVTRLTLSRLPHAQAEAMVTQVAKGKALPAEVGRQLVAKTDGVPLFVEELTRMVVESELLQEREDYYELTGSLPALAIPTTLHDSLMARLDRLTTGKDIAQLAAMLGRTFPYELLCAVAPWDETTLQHGLARLVEAELLYQRGVLPRATYLFKHVLVQDAAYQSLLKSTRQQYHRRIAHVLAEQFPETAETQPELLAYHYTQADLIAQAIPYWQRAGQRARERSAYVEAIAHLTMGLELLETLPDTPERARQELDLLTTLGPALTTITGPTAPDVERVYVRARALCQAVGDPPQLFGVLVGLHVFYNSRGEFQKSRELAEQLLSLAQRVQDPALLLAAHRALGELWFQLGEFTTALAHCEQGIALSQEHGALALGYGGGLGVDCLRFAARILWELGYLDQALQRSHEALTLAQTYTHPYSLAAALCQMAHVHHLRREAPQSQEWAETAEALAREQGFWYWLMWGTFTWGWARATQGAPDPGIAQMRQSMAAKHAAGNEEARSFALAQLAEVYLDMGQAEEGLLLLAEARTVASHTGERWWEAELYRLQGELLLVRSVANQVGAEACFRQALDVARCQGAKSLELRAAMSLSRLWQQQGKRDAAHELLAEVYGWFTEGFDTADLREAQGLLGE